MNAQNNHLKNLSRIVGHNVSRYDYILSKDDLLSAYTEAHADLNYRLRKEAKRDRFILNTSGLQKEIDEILNNLMREVSSTLAQMVAEDARNAIQEVIDSVNLLDGTSAPKRPHKAPQDFATRFGRMMGKALGNASANIMKAITRGENKKKRGN